MTQNQETLRHTKLSKSENTNRCRKLIFQDFYCTQTYKGNKSIFHSTKCLFDLPGSKVHSCIEIIILVLYQYFCTKYSSTDSYVHHTVVLTSIQLYKIQALHSPHILGQHSTVRITGTRCMNCALRILVTHTTYNHTVRPLCKATFALH